ncbi:MAG: diguanylate cyclase/phosphodiesterase [Novosphingobium sp.]|nr:diguanylate cyclase/phosphodiesterase [Novosphingobium sp.]
MDGDPSGAHDKVGANTDRVARERIFITEQTSDALIAAYGHNLASRLPMIYCVVLVNIVSLAFFFHGAAPDYLTTWLPACFVAAAAARAFYWMPANAKRRSFAQVKRSVIWLPFTGVILSLGLAIWALTLYGYGNETQQSLVQYASAITCFTGVLGMTHSPATAIMMAISVMAPSSVVFLLHDSPTRYPIVGLQIVVSVLLVIINRGHHRDFVNLELSRQDLACRERESAGLAEHNRVQATRDPLTGAMNRRGILAFFEGQVVRTGRPLPWLALVDLDGFKLINDTFGHAAGDAVLCAISERIEALPEISGFGRMGGDEFALLLPGGMDHAAVRAALEQLAESIARPIPFGDRMLAIRASIGLHKCADANVSGSLERADVALYKAKETRNAAIGDFTPQDEVVMRDKRAITRVFTSADFESQLSLVYQPIMDCDIGRTVAFEALARWSPDGALWLPPTDFIHLAETTGRMGELTSVILAKALRECRVWDYGCSLNVNLSARDILREDAAPWITKLVYDADAPANKIVFEITETALVNDYRRAADNLAKLRGMGFRIALDDFGTGQSSLSHVNNLPLDHIKIDQTFARDMTNSDSSRAIVGTIVALARQLRLECIIEGIETPEQQVIARSLGLRMMQGYHFSRPIRALEAIAGIAHPPLMRAFGGG